MFGTCTVSSTLSSSCLWRLMMKNWQSTHSVVYQSDEQMTLILGCFFFLDTRHVASARVGIRTLGGLWISAGTAVKFADDSNPMKSLEELSSYRAHVLAGCESRSFGLGRLLANSIPTYSDWWLDKTYYIHCQISTVVLWWAKSVTGCLQKIAKGRSRLWL